MQELLAPPSFEADEDSYMKDMSVDHYQDLGEKTPRIEMEGF